MIIGIVDHRQGALGCRSGVFLCTEHKFRPSLNHCFFLLSVRSCPSALIVTVCSKRVRIRPLLRLPLYAVYFPSERPITSHGAITQCNESKPSMSLKMPLNAVPLFRDRAEMVFAPVMPCRFHAL